MKIYISHNLSKSGVWYRIFSYAVQMKSVGLISEIYNNKIDFSNTKQEPAFEEVMADPVSCEELEKDMTYLAKEVKLDIAIAQPFCTWWGAAWIDVMHHWRIPVITEIDDDILHVPADNGAYESFTPGSTRREVTEEQLAMSDAIIVSTPTLQKLYKTYNKYVYVIPNSIDFKVWDQLNKDKKKNNKIVIGWEGGQGHESDLKLIVPAIKKIVEKYPNVIIKLIGGSQIKELTDLPQVESQIVWKTVGEYPKFMADQSIDIMLAPLVDTYFNRGKSNLRFLEAAAMKTPTVCSNVAPYKETPAICCSSTKEWVDALSKLIEDEQYRIQLGEQSYHFVKKHFNIERWARVYNKVLRKTIRKAKHEMENVDERIKQNEGK